MYSINQKEDRELMLQIAQTIEVLVKIKLPQALDLAEQFGQHYLELEEKVKTYDYTKEDFIRNRVDTFIENTIK